MLPLTHEGMRRLIDGRLIHQIRNCATSRGNRSGRRASMSGPSTPRARIAAAIPLVLQKFSTPLYQGINIYSRPITKEGLRVLEPLGFTPGARYDGAVRTASADVRSLARICRR